MKMGIKMVDYIYYVGIFFVLFSVVIVFFQYKKFQRMNVEPSGSKKTASFKRLNYISLLGDRSKLSKALPTNGLSACDDTKSGKGPSSFSKKNLQNK